MVTHAAGKLRSVARTVRVRHQLNWEQALNSAADFVQRLPQKDAAGAGTERWLQIKYCPAKSEERFRAQRCQLGLHTVQAARRLVHGGSQTYKAGRQSARIRHQIVKDYIGPNKINKVAPPAQKQRKH